MSLLKQSTARNVAVFMTDSSDHITGKTGLTLTITASKDGGAFASISPTVTERGNGWYSLALTTSHTDTLGDLAFHVTAAGADPSDFTRQVVTALPGEKVAVSLATADVSGNLPANLTAILGTALTEGSTGRIKAAFTTFFDVAAPVLTTASVNQTGNSFTLIGPAGSGLTALGDTRLGNLDTAVSTRSTLTAGGVWDLNTSGHTTAGTFGGLMAAAASAGDPWTTTLPGSYLPGTAGYIVGNNLDAQLSPISARVLLALPSAAPNANNGLPIITVGGTTLGYTVQTVTSVGVTTAISGAGQQSIADTILGRNINGGSSTGRTVKQALAAQRNKVAFDVPGAGQFTVYDTDDSTPLWTGTYTSSAAADPVVSIDPT